ncbi:hypothetical protein KR51_00028800 [Rubidibacter lacunae KORDI 51-2]|uniref:Uncharacterized protein n=1 Tax=Rubidibacter lacunae KORDI 51-2 TaxID=582515 RepID=U5DI62_9CHRO|nr:hypothetical protein [Rubidibacter lacunae]ERN40622.1 hypothetical protein KR51_00028800 [Rubidibacter lacunae KORDI 51-2]
MDITDSTKELISQVQRLKSQFKDLASATFIDFYCQCRQGCDYLLPQQTKQSVGVFDILMLFFQCLDADSKSTFVELMWRDVVGPTLGEYQLDEQIERSLADAFASPELRESVLAWDRQPRSDGGVTLILRDLLQAIETAEAEARSKATRLPSS